MLLTPLAIAAAGLSAATAFLLPPQLAQAQAQADADVDIDSIESVPWAIVRAPEHDLTLDCPGCPIQVRNRHGSLMGVASHLQMNFAVEHLPTHDRLLLNGFELYPHADPLHSTLTAEQVPDFDEETADPRMPIAPKFVDVVPPELGFGLQWQPVAETGSGMRLISLDFQVIEVGNFFVNGIPNIRVQLLKSPAGALMIGKIETTESQTGEANQTEPQQKCATFLCKWRAMVAEQFRGMRGHRCAKMGHHMGKEQLRPNPQYVGDVPAGLEQLELHEHSWKMLFKNLGSHILFPILVGIAAGVSVSM